jgi:hypothetical protein
MSGFALGLVVLGLSSTANAEAVLESATGVSSFPQQIAIDTEVRAQVERSVVTLTFPPLSSEGDHVLTVPSPAGAYSVGVDMDQGEGFQPLAIQAKAPPPGPGSDAGASEAVKTWQGTTPLLARISGLKPGPLTVRVHFLRLLRRYQKQVRFEIGADRCPLRAASDPPATLSFTMRLRTFRPLSRVDVTGATPRFEKPSPTEARLTLAPTPLTGSLRATVIYEEGGKGIAANLLTHRAPDADPLGGSDGYFLLAVDADTLALAASPPRRLSLVIDHSGSMAGDKIAQARDAALAMLDTLRPGDQFAIHAFNSTVSSFRSDVVPASAENLAAAREFIASLDAYDSTNLEGGIVAGLGGHACPAPKTDPSFDAMVLLSDGMATDGETRSAAIYQSSIDHNCLESRIFTFAVGTGANVPLLEAIARAARGRNFVLNNAQAASDLAKAVRQLFEDIYSVRVTDLALALDGVAAHDVLPEKPLDLFDGGQVLLVGRHAPLNGVARLTGKAGGAPFSLEIPFVAPALVEENEAIKYVWATEKVGALLAAIGRGEDRTSLQQEITELGLGYRIQTPFTSFASPPAGTTGGGGSSAGGGSYSGGGGMAADVNLLTGGILLALAALARRRRVRRARGS